MVYSSGRDSTGSEVIGKSWDISPSVSTSFRSRLLSLFSSTRTSTFFEVTVKVRTSSTPSFGSVWVSVTTSPSLLEAG